MATLTITLPDPTTEWVEERARSEGYSGVDAYVGGLIERERAQADEAMDWPEQPPLSIEDLRRIVDESRASGISSKTVGEVFEEAKEIAKARGYLRD